MNSCSPISVFILMFAIFSAISTTGARTREQFKGAIFVSFVASLFTTLFMFLAEQLR